ncbi:hypothetical protein [Bacillus sp. V2I10]|uniref:hypothetical protein n=1 Tax=Bacillus sp. V2I10 TaxID=3042276 RepID=UPI0027895328|nr:hypothetical protein [Bacillus sp. V2I10]MDQ0857753.1 glycerol-3-phosphate acyltransferase PlsY [Bacillus sp. V2I10]
MKMIAIPIVMMMMLTGISFGIDILQGFELRTSLFNAVNPFLVMETPELAVFIFFLFCFVMDAFLTFYRKRKNVTKNAKKQPQS